MKLGTLIPIYNVDKLRIYKNGKKIADLYIGGQTLNWYLKEDERTKHLLHYKVKSMNVLHLAGSMVLEIII